MAKHKKILQKISTENNKIHIDPLFSKIEKDLYKNTPSNERNVAYLKTGSRKTSNSKKGQVSTSEDLQARLDTFKNDLDEARKEVDKLSKSVEKEKVKTTEILAIFITLFTFISVNVNIFTQVQDVASAIWFMGLMTICCIFLLTFLFSIINTDFNNTKPWKTPWFIILCILFLLFGLSLIIINKYDWSPKLNIQREIQLKDITLK